MLSCHQVVFVVKDLKSLVDFPFYNAVDALLVFNS